MKDDNLTEQVRQLMADSFGLDESDLPASPSQTGFARWTSLHHMVLLVALEEHFAVSFSMDEMISMTSLDRILEVLRDKKAVGLAA